MGTRVQQRFGDQPKDKQITVEMISGLGGPEKRAVVQFPTIQMVWDKFFEIESSKKVVLRIPFTRFKFIIAVKFPSSEPIQVNAEVIGADIDGLRVHQLEDNFVQANLVHVPYRRIQNASDECTVSCADGTSRSGMGACIDCPGPRGIVRLCC